jgi:hypothetical protein
MGINMEKKERQLVSFTTRDELGQNPAVKYILGLLAGIGGNLDGIEPNPADSCIPLNAVQKVVVDGETRQISQDLGIYSFKHGADVRALLAKVVTIFPPPAPPDGSKNTGLWPVSEGTTYSLLGLPRFGGGVWSELAKGVVLKYKDSNNNYVIAPTNPHGLVQIGRLLYIIDYDSQKIYILDYNELNGQGPGDYEMKTAPFDVAAAIAEAEEDLPEEARGQSIIALTDSGDPENIKTYIYALFITPTHDPTTGEVTLFDESYLVRLSVNGTDGSLSYTAGNIIELGPNAAEIGSVRTDENNDAIDEMQLVIPVLGDIQKPNGTNGDASKLMAISAFGSWQDGPRTLLRGDSASGVGLAGHFDFRQIVASSAGKGTAVVYMLNASFDSNYMLLNWEIFSTRSRRLFSITDPGGLSITQAIDDGIICLEDSGSITGENGIYFLALMLENGSTHTGDRLWAFLGTQLLITNANSYGSPQKPDNYYVLFDRGVGPGKIGGENVNSADLTAEAIRQADVGVSLKHSVSAIRAPSSSGEGE